MTPADFAPHFKAKMVTAYPKVSGVTVDEAYFATDAEMDAAFQRVLDSENLRRVCELELEKQGRTIR